MASDEILTYWLIPAEPRLSYFRSLIRDFGERFDAPLFEPHVTLYVTKPDKEDPTSVIERAITDAERQCLSVAGINFSDKFTKTLFVQFRPDIALSRLSENLRSASVAQSEYQLNPHLSLIYKTMSPETKEQIANSIRLPFDEVSFDSVQAVISPAKIESRADVESWRVVAGTRFT